MCNQNNYTAVGDREDMRFPMDQCLPIDAIETHTKSLENEDNEIGKYYIIKKSEGKKIYK